MRCETPTRLAQPRGFVAGRSTDGHIGRHDESVLANERDLGELKVEVSEPASDLTRHVRDSERHENLCPDQVREGISEFHRSGVGGEVFIVEPGPEVVQFHFVFEYGVVGDQGIDDSGRLLPVIRVSVGNTGDQE